MTKHDAMLQRATKTIIDDQRTNWFKLKFLQRRYANVVHVGEIARVDRTGLEPVSVLVPVVQGWPDLAEMREWLTERGRRYTIQMRYRVQHQMWTTQRVPVGIVIKTRDIEEAALFTLYYG